MAYHREKQKGEYLYGWESVDEMEARLSTHKQGVLVPFTSLVYIQLYSYSGV